jgi:hypothetical protein
MALDGSGNPITPVYSKTAPVINEGCVTAGSHNNQDFYNPGISGRTAEVLAGREIDVDDLSDASVDRFRVHTDLTEQLTAALDIEIYSAGGIETLPVLTGKEIIRVLATWDYNQVIASQTITGGVPTTVLDALDRLYDYTGLTVTSDISVILNGDTGEGFTPESIATDTKIVTFGNYLAYGKGLSLDGLADTEAQTYLDSFVGLTQTETRTNRVSSVFGLGSTNEKFYIMYPKAWGLGTFQKGIFVGGFIRLKNVAGILKHTLGGGDTEIDLILDNGEGHTEAFYLYETFFDNQVDAVTPINIT